MENVTSHVKTFLMASRFEMDSRSSVVRTDWAAIRTAQATRSKKIASLRMAWAIRSKKIVRRSHGSGYPFKKNLSAVRMARAIHSKKICPLFARLGLSVQKEFVCRSHGSSYPFKKNCQPFEVFELALSAPKLFSKLCIPCNFEQASPN